MSVQMISEKEKDSTTPPKPPGSERRADPRVTIDQFYSVEVAMPGLKASTHFQFKIRDISARGLCLVVREDSALLPHLKPGVILDMTYWPVDKSIPPLRAKTQIRHVSQDPAGKYKGHYLVGLLVLAKDGLEDVKG